MQTLEAHSFSHSEIVTSADLAGIAVAVPAKFDNMIQHAPEQNLVESTSSQSLEGRQLLDGRRASKLLTAISLPSPHIAPRAMQCAYVLQLVLHV